MDELAMYGMPDHEPDDGECHDMCEHASACDRVLELVGVSNRDTAIAYVLRCTECDEFEHFKRR